VVKSLEILEPQFSPLSTRESKKYSLPKVGVEMDTIKHLKGL
jgi:hypothetical protein